jgi:hypothetical protein
MNQRGEWHTTTPEILLGAYIATAWGDTQPPFKPAASLLNFPTPIPDCIPLGETSYIGRTKKMRPADDQRSLPDKAFFHRG